MHCFPGPLPFRFICPSFEPHAAALRGGMNRRWCLAWDVDIMVGQSLQSGRYPIKAWKRDFIFFIRPSARNADITLDETQYEILSSSRN